MPSFPDLSTSGSETVQMSKYTTYWWYAAFCEDEVHSIPN